MKGPSNIPPQRVTRFCACGAELSWQSIGSAGNRRWFAWCTRPECGKWSTTHDEPDGGLHRFLLADRPTQRPVPPWLRLYSETAALGWQIHPVGCSHCDSPLMVNLRPSGPGSSPALTFVVLCLQCGSVATQGFAAGEQFETFSFGSAWTAPAQQTQQLKSDLRQMVAARAEPPDLGDFFGFS